MKTVLSDLQPARLWAHFDRIRCIPRASGEEADVRRYVEQVAAERGWSCRTDRAGNVSVRVPATAARPGARGVVLQAHLDMVCEKESGLDFDFSRSAIPARVEGDWVAATGTTLGADNGIGVAAALAICEEPGVEHGPIELLLTVDEEAGGSGAEALEPDFVEGRTMINLDSEDDGVIVIGCAGGCSTEVEYAARRAAAPKDYAPVRLSISGLRGGHSGLTIHENRGNAIKLLARVMHRFFGKADLYLGACQGGNKPNAIPREASATLFVPAAFVERARQMVAATYEEIASEIRSIDPDFRMVLEPADPPGLPPFDCSSTRRLVRLLVALPHGVVAMSRDLPGIVESSTNLAILRTDVDRVTIVNNSRSLYATSLRGVLDQIDSISRLAGADSTESASYPPWRADPSSPLLVQVKNAARDAVGVTPALYTMHAGLECGVIAQRIPGMDIVSFGPLIEGAHAPGERVSVPSVARFYRVLGALLSRLT